MYEDTQIEAHVRYSTFKKTIKVFSNSDGHNGWVKIQLNK